MTPEEFRAKLKQAHTRADVEKLMHHDWRHVHGHYDELTALGNAVIARHLEVCCRGCEGISGGVRPAEQEAAGVAA